MNKRFLLLIIIVVILGGIVWWKDETKPVNTQNPAKQTIVIRAGTGTQAIGTLLKSKQLIRSQLAFMLMVRKLGLEGKIQAGDFRLSQSQNLEAIVDGLTHGSLDIWVTIPEGMRAEEIADTLQKDLPDYQPSWRDKLIPQEGYLFPDTYLIPKDESIDDFISLLNKNFEQKYTTLGSPSTSLSKQQIVTIASMVEREARYASDRPLVASVILNRLRIGMPLQIDATIQYALGYQNDQNSWWKKDLATDDLHIVSPYNTYTNTGLPPTPISNPGLDVLKAVVNAPKTDYLYYVSDKSGHNHYAATLEEHNANIKKYGL
jgi:UPF0755 protein